jgi:hypothetical protein
MVARRGKKRALITIGHKILCASNPIIKTKKLLKYLCMNIYLKGKRKTGWDISGGN